jgi:hypothetical protein
MIYFSTQPVSIGANCPLMIMSIGRNKLHKSKDPHSGHVWFWGSLFGLDLDTWSLSPASSTQSDHRLVKAGSTECILTECSFVRI